MTDEEEGETVSSENIKLKTVTYLDPEAFINNYKNVFFMMFLLIVSILSLAAIVLLTISQLDKTEISKQRAARDCAITGGILMVCSFALLIYMLSSRSYSLMQKIFTGVVLVLGIGQFILGFTLGATKGDNPMFDLVTAITGAVFLASVIYFFFHYWTVSGWFQNTTKWIREKYGKLVVRDVTNPPAVIEMTKH